ncbi:hypothetical protein Nepgr_023087 [Nepenthes gracilis]|uniref:Uncharacterized protein n=1 Tax=Nepenthes gracilis TaxID=150966 RepID=A0AAD3T0M5_NEPGR|nr:hypothetical protein Nepgr_023087 [Nepenthes gracilis]
MWTKAAAPALHNSKTAVRDSWHQHVNNQHSHTTPTAHSSKRGKPDHLTYRLAINSIDHQYSSKIQGTNSSLHHHNPRIMHTASEGQNQQESFAPAATDHNPIPAKQQLYQATFGSGSHGIIQRPWSTHIKSNDQIVLTYQDQPI